jgi:hypothetical protein
VVIASNASQQTTIRDSSGISSPTRPSLAKDVPLKPKTAGKDAGWRRVALRFRVAANAGADWRVDDVLVDPACRY